MRWHSCRPSTQAAQAGSSEGGGSTLEELGFSRKEAARERRAGHYALGPKRQRNSSPSLWLVTNGPLVQKCCTEPYCTRLAYRPCAQLALSACFTMLLWLSAPYQGLFVSLPLNSKPASMRLAATGPALYVRAWQNHSRLKTEQSRMINGRNHCIQHEGQLSLKHESNVLATARGRLPEIKCQLSLRG